MAKKVILGTDIARDAFKTKCNDNFTELYDKDVALEELINTLDANKVDNSRVLTDVPVNAKFTDTTYSEISTSEIDAGTSSTLRTITGRRVKYILDKVQGWIGNLTKADVGLDSVDNVKQATKVEFDEHKAGSATHVKPARFVVGTSTSGWTEKDCDYLCDGTADQTEINAAITALPATGGEIVILDGTYNITAKINVNKNNVSIKGNGNATILKRMFNSSVKEGVITLTGRSGCKIANLQIEGNRTSYASGNNYGIYLNSSSNNTVTGNTCNNNNYGIYLNSSSNNTVTGNTCNNNNYSIYLSTSSSNNTVTGNTCNNNSYGISLYTSSSNNTVTGNTCNDNNNYGIYLSSSSNNTVTGNTCNDNNNHGIYLGSSSNNTVTGNTCIRGTGLATDYTTSQHTIQLKGTSNSYNLISNNNCMGKAPVVEGGTGNTLVNNKWDAA